MESADASRLQRTPTSGCTRELHAADQTTRPHNRFSVPRGAGALGAQPTFLSEGEGKPPAVFSARPSARPRLDQQRAANPQALQTPHTHPGCGGATGSWAPRGAKDSAERHPVAASP